jgi:hypothetical protein
VDLHDRVRAIGLAAEHARELELPKSLLESRKLLEDVALDRFGLGPAFGGRQLEEPGVVVDLLTELLDARDLLFDVRALAQDDLRLGLIVPEARRAGAIVQLFELSPQGRDVKDAPLAS